MKHIDWLLLSDLDSTLQGPDGELQANECAVLETFLSRNGFLVVISGSSVEGVVRRVASRIRARYRDSMLFYPENGSCCVRLGTSGLEYLYNLAPEFDSVRNDIERVIRRAAASLGLGAVVLGRSATAVPGTVCLDNRTSSTTVSLNGQADKRQAAADAIWQSLDQAVQAKVKIRVAGRRSIDIYPAGKDYAVGHFANAILPDLGFDLQTKVIIAGDAFGETGCDAEMLHDRFLGAFVVCVGGNVPAKNGFTIIKPAQAAYAATYEVLRLLLGAQPIIGRLSDHSPSTGSRWSRAWSTPRRSRRVAVAQGPTPGERRHLLAQASRRGRSDGFEEAAWAKSWRPVPALAQHCDRWPANRRLASRRNELAYRA